MELRIWAGHGCWQCSEHGSAFAPRAARLPLTQPTPTLSPFPGFKAGWSGPHLEERGAHGGIVVGVHISSAARQPVPILLPLLPLILVVTAGGSRAPCQVGIGGVCCCCLCRCCLLVFLLLLLALLLAAALLALSALIARVDLKVLIVPSVCLLLAAVCRRPLLLLLLLVVRCCCC